MSNSSEGSGCGCFTTIAVVVIIWALLFGVSVNGKHYGMSGCSCDKGVEFDR